ncbi:MAG: hypothetical protein LBS12_06650 [Prevotellaceae bacterium]|nr:hypothetical protein [Prevotellaceae bacterium]
MITELCYLYNIGVPHSPQTAAAACYRPLLPTTVAGSRRRQPTANCLY